MRSRRPGYDDGSFFERLPQALEGSPLKLGKFV